MNLKRLFRTFLMAVLILSAGVAGANGKASLHQTEGTTVFPAELRKELVPAVSNAPIEDVIGRELEIPASQQKQTSYYYRYIDLNDDGVTDALVLSVGPYTSGSGGSTMFWLSPDKKGKWQIHQKWTLIQTPVLMTENNVNGYRGLVVHRSGGGAAPAWILLTYQNGQYTTVNDGIILPFTKK